MKILFLSNLYPPHVIGGYETLCMEAVDGLAKRGHEVSVLTSTYGYDREITEGNIYRLLSLEGDLQFYKMKDAWTYPQRKTTQSGTSAACAILKARYCFYLGYVEYVQ